LSIALPSLVIVSISVVVATSHLRGKIFAYCLLCHHSFPCPHSRYLFPKLLTVDILLHVRYLFSRWFHVTHAYRVPTNVLVCLSPRPTALRPNRLVACIMFSIAQITCLWKDVSAMERFCSGVIYLAISAQTTLRICEHAWYIDVGIKRL